MTTSLDSATDLLGSAYSALDLEDENLLQATDTPGRLDRGDWITRGGRLSLADTLNADRIFFVEDNPVIVFFKDEPGTEELRRLFNRAWCMAITADRLACGAEQLMPDGVTFPIPDYTVEHWSVYEAGRLSKTPPVQFREFVLRAFGARPDASPADIHGTKGAVPVCVGEPSQRKGVAANHVEAFANAIRKTVRCQQDNLPDGIMLAWAFRRDAIEAADRLRELEHTDLNFIRLEQVRIDSARFREQLAALSTAHADYENFLTFLQPPKVEMGWKRIAARTYKFDVSETAVLNAGAKIINMQWDFHYGERFSSTPDFSFIRSKKKEPALQTQYEFPRAGTITTRLQSAGRHGRRRAVVGRDRGRMTNMVYHGLEIPIDRLTAFCRGHRIRRLALFGSILRDDFRPDSDVDMLVEFEPGARTGFAFFGMQDELSEILGRNVDLNTPQCLSKYFRDEVLEQARVVYAAA